MLVSEYGQGVSDFLSYDFLNGPSQGKYLAVVDSGAGKKCVKEVNLNEMDFLDKAALKLKGALKLSNLVKYVSESLLAQARGSKGYHPEKWKEQFALLERKVATYNAKHWIKIKFENPLLDTLEIQVSVPKIPDSLIKPHTTYQESFKVKFSPLTDFSTVEKAFTCHVGAEGFLTDGPNSDRKVLADLADRKVTVAKWVSQNEGKILKIEYSDIDVSQYVKYVKALVYIDGFFDGYAKSMHDSAPPSSRVGMMGVPVDEEKKLRFKKAVVEKYQKKS